MQQAPDDLYTRGKYRLAWDRKRDGSLRTPFLQVVWYDEAAGRNRQRSTGTTVVAEAEDELDRVYLKRERGQAVCPACGQQIRTAGKHLLTTAIADYLIAREGRTSIGSIRPRLAHITAYLTETDQLGSTCDAIDEDWIDAFREWAIEVPIVSPNGLVRSRTPGTVEASVRQLAAAINYAHGRKDTLFPAAFAAKPPKEVSRSPVYRADIKMLAAMFRFCTDPPDATAKVTRKSRIIDREQLHRFLQISVATWARPDAAHDVSTDPKRDQWHPEFQALNLNPKGRPQTKKFRPIIPIARQMAPLLEANTGYYVSVASVRQSFEVMQTHLKLPADGESGLKLIRRSVAHLARKRLGERDWIEGRIMLGHHVASTSDLYAPFTPGYLGRALKVTERIIDEIVKLAPAAFAQPGWRDEPSSSSQTAGAR